MYGQIEMENMSHLSALWPDYQGEEGTHHTQGGRPTKLILLFWTRSQEGHKAPMRLVSVRVPKGTPIYKVRSLINFIEHELYDMYGYGQRANMVLVGDELSTEFRLDRNLPVSGVTYV